MTSLSAAGIALLVGAAAALVLYFISSKKPDSIGVLAFLRFLWIALLVYAIVSPDIENKKTINRPTVLWILADTSSSVALNATEVANEIQKDHSIDGVECLVVPYAENSIPAEQPWIYVGDGHIPSPNSKSRTPVGVYQLPAKPLAKPRLILGVVAPQTVVAESQFSYKIYALNEDVKTERVWEGQVFKEIEGNLTASEKLGSFPLRVRASDNESSDEMIVWVNVEKEFRKVGLVSKSGHPHEMMVRRWAKKRRYTVVDSVVPNVIIIGKSSLADSAQTLFLGGGLPSEYRIRQEYRPGKASLPQSVYLWYSKEGSQDFSEVHWYLSALVDQNVNKVFEDYLDQFIARTTPPKIVSSGPQDIIAGQTVGWNFSLVGPKGSPEPATAGVGIYRKGKMIEVPLLEEYESGIYSFNTSFDSAGTHEVRIEMENERKSYTLNETIEVRRADVETITPFNSSLMKNWEREAQWVSTDTNSQAYDQWELDRQSMELSIKNPQHYTWWYWGLVLLLAASEWLIRRRQGLI